MEYPEYLVPSFRFRDAARAAAFPLNTLRSNYQRGWFQSFADGLSTGRGRARRLCLGDILILAIASRLIDIGFRPLDAYNAARPFGLVARTPKGFPRRMPFQLFDREKFDTLLVLPMEGAHQVVPAKKDVGISLRELRLDDPFGTASVVLSLNAVEATVFEQLGLPFPGQSDAA